MPQEAENLAAELLEGLHAQALLLDQMERLSARQRRLMRGSTAGSDEWLAHRAALIKTLGESKNRLGSLAAEWRRRMACVSDDHSLQIERLLDRNDALIRKLAKDGERDLRELAIQKAVVGQELRAAHSTQAALHAYQSRAAGGAHLDLTNGELG
jgi:hypothetical protein